MCAKNFENPTMLSKVTAKNVGDVFFETHCSSSYLCNEAVSAGNSYVFGVEIYSTVITCGFL